MSKPGVVDENGILWKGTSVGKLTDSFDGCKNLWDTLVNSAKNNLTNPAAGQRAVLETTMVDGFEKYTMGEYDWLNYAEYFKQVEDLGSGMAKTLPGLSKGDTVVIYAETQRAWMIAAYAAWRQGYVVGTIYATLGDEGALFGINQSKCKAVVADSKLLKVLAKVASKFTTLKDVISITEPPADAAEALTKAGIKIHSMTSVTATGAEVSTPPTAADSDDVAVLMYTSGTTGNPKGVLISHKAVLSVVSSTMSNSSATALNGRNYLNSNSVYLAYLPLAHIMELAVEISCFAVGCKVGYGNPGTLAPTSIKMLQTTPPQIGDAAKVQPTVFVAAPAVLDKILIAIKAKFGATGSCVQSIISSGIASGFANYENGGVGTRNIIAKAVFRKAQALLGGKVELMLTGSAPLAKEVQMWVQTVFACRVRQGYGLTETCAATCVALATDNSTTQVGPPQASACIRLRDWEEGGYKNADKDGEIGMRRGEVLIGGPTVALGYLVDAANPDPEIVAKNNEDFVTIDGIRYFCTGDIGQYTKDGNLQIIDRKKDLVKLQQGEYVALSKVENALKACKYTALPMTYATSTMDYCIALICPVVPELKALAKELGVGGDLSEWCKDEKIIAAVLKEVGAACKAAKLQRFETPTKIILIDDLWTPENDMLTAVQKLKRRQIADRHMDQINQVYVGIPKV